MSRYAFEKYAPPHKRRDGTMSYASFQIKYQYALFSTCFRHVSISKEYFSRLACLKMKALLSLTKLLKGVQRGPESLIDENLPSSGFPNKIHFLKKY